MCIFCVLSLWTECSRKTTTPLGHIPRPGSGNGAGAGGMQINADTQTHHIPVPIAHASAPQCTIAGPNPLFSIIHGRCESPSSPTPADSSETLSRGPAIRNRRGSGCPEEEGLLCTHPAAHRRVSCRGQGLPAEVLTHPRATPGGKVALLSVRRGDGAGHGAFWDGERCHPFDEGNCSIPSRHYHLNPRHPPLHAALPSVDPTECVSAGGRLSC